MSQRIPVREEPQLHLPCEDDEHGDAHVHPAYGLYDERTQVIKIDAHLPFERQRETFLHENLHAMMSAGQLDALLVAEAEGLDEHLVGILAPILLCWMRENPRAVAYLCEVRQ